MLIAVSAVSGLALVAAIGLKSYEIARGTMFFAGPRTDANHALVSFVTWTVRGCRTSSDFIRREVALKGLHIIAYLALIGVRSIERKLERLTVLVRRLRRNRYHRPTTPTTPQAEHGGVES